ncbi:MAG: CinA family nicotinamide mononucleotide deamidase-related protein [Deltaproteobacteria bacterium]|nr:CinA family nicotinamide mononucleotide deamidase-related protein [Deltaproteobacteria bacterium]
MPLTAIVLAQGDEIVSGSTQDTNSGWLGRELLQRGVRLVGVAAAPDDERELADLIGYASRRCDLVVSGGGLGPTSDDVTADAVARAAALPLCFDDEAWRQVAARMRTFRPQVPECNRKQAMLPRGALRLDNPIGTAPGFAVDLGRCRLFCLPGVPSELKEMAARHVWPWLERQGLRPLPKKVLHVCGVGESMLQERLSGVALPPGIRIGYQARFLFNSIVLYADGAADDAGERLTRAREAVLERIGGDVFGEDGATLPQVVGAGLRRRRWRLAVAESCTAGGLGALITEVAGSSEWFMGGVIAYDNEIKREWLGVSAQTLERHGAVSEPCAREMAEGVRRRLRAEAGLAITGVAGPGGGAPDKPVGTVCFGLSTPVETRTRRVSFGDRGRDLVRTAAAASALEWLRRRLLDKG